jgi:hypothetical protein
MNNLSEILNDEELSTELDKAYAIAAPYRARVQYKLQLLSDGFWFDSLVHHQSGVTLIAAYTDIPFVHNMLKV